MIKKFENTYTRDAFLDREYPVRRATDVPGMYVVPGTSLVVSVRLMTVEVIDTAKLPSWQGEPNT